MWKGDAPLVRSAPASTAASGVDADMLSRQAALNVPVLTPRDGPIASISPGASTTTSLQASVESGGECGAVGRHAGSESWPTLPRALRFWRR